MLRSLVGLGDVYKRQSIQGVFNTEVTKQTSVWVAAGWVQLTAFITCVVIWLSLIHI
ncbi:hypothetical protein BN3589_00127 [Clostridium sp. C105KSO14]|nr:hypothetical protein BN3589_00127 [Clostridium sp. C105KSO14]